MQINKDKICELLAEERYEEALAEIDTYISSGCAEDDESCILKGSIYGGLGERELEWEAIQKGLEYNCENAELYLMLGNYLFAENLQQAYLCYENAWFYAENSDKEEIGKFLMQVKEEYGISVPKTAIVILSYNLLNYMKRCIESIRTTVPECAREIIVVDNASQDGSAEWLREQKDIKLIENKENVGFPKGCNQGIAVAERESDIFLLNNDTIVPPNALFWLRMGLYDAKENGAAGSVSNYVSNMQQVAEGKNSVEELMEFARMNNVPMKYPYEEKLFLIGFALLIKRTALEEIGVLDERFTPGNSEDVDYGLRMVEAGYRNILCRNSFILHFGSRSFGKLGKGYIDILTKNHKKLNEKWGIELENYMLPRTELIAEMQESQEMPLNVLFIGCGCGATMARVRAEYPQAEIYGIERSLKMARLAAGAGSVICGDIENMELPYTEDFFDCCIVDDALENMYNPQKVLVNLQKYIKKDGKIIVSAKNINHWTVILPLIMQDSFSYSGTGILDRAHLGMYTRYEFLRLIAEAGYEIKNVMYTTKGEPDEKGTELLKMLLQYKENGSENMYMAYQYIITATVKR